MPPPIAVCGSSSSLFPWGNDREDDIPLRSFSSSSFSCGSVTSSSEKQQKQQQKQQVEEGCWSSKGVGVCSYGSLPLFRHVVDDDDGNDAEAPGRSCSSSPIASPLPQTHTPRKNEPHLESCWPNCYNDDINNITADKSNSNIRTEHESLLGQESWCADSAHCIVDGNNSTTRKSSHRSVAWWPSAKMAKLMPSGSIAHSVVVAIGIGAACGGAAYLYAAALEQALDAVWRQLPAALFFNFDDVDVSNENNTIPHNSTAWLRLGYMPIAVAVLSTLAGLVVRFAGGGSPGDLAHTVGQVHARGYVDVDVAIAASSLGSIVSGASVGPEAPLVALCAALAGWLSRRVLGTTNRNVLRKHTLMGMSGALAALFGCPLSGALFSLEVCSRFGAEYFEHSIEAMLAGQVCLAVYQVLQGRGGGNALWQITGAAAAAAAPLATRDPVHMVYGAAFGVAGAATAYVYKHGHARVLAAFKRWNLLPHENAVPRIWVGAVVVIAVGLLVPQTLFWGEAEFQTIATMAPVSTLPHVYPAVSVIGFEMHDFVTALVVGMAKLVTISFSVASGFRGGIIFPLFASGAALGRAAYILCPFIPVQLCVLCMSAALLVALTRTALSATVVLAFLAGEPNALPAILAASLVSLICTSSMPFIATQVPRADLDQSLYRNKSSSLTTSISDGELLNVSVEAESLTPTSDVSEHNGDNNRLVERNV